MSLRAAGVIAGLAFILAAPAAQPQSEKNDMALVDRAAARYVNDLARTVWEAPQIINGRTVTDGALVVGTTRSKLRWTQFAGKRVELSLIAAGTSIPAGKIHLLALKDDRVLLLEERTSTTGSREPMILRPLAAVFGIILFQPLSGFHPPKAFPAPASTGNVIWEKWLVKSGRRYRPGRLAAVSGDLEVFWLMEVGRAPVLITLDAPGGGELPAVEEMLFLWTDDASGMTFVCQIRYPLVNDKTVASLVCQAVVKTDALLAGLRRAQPRA